MVALAKEMITNMIIGVISTRLQYLVQATQTRASLRHPTRQCYGACQSSQVAREPAMTSSAWEVAAVMVVSAYSPTYSLDLPPLTWRPSTAG
jgi:hypothetical protein